MCPPMADTATEVRVVAAAEPGSLAAEANAAVRPVSMPVVDRVASGVGTAVTPIVLIIGKYFGWTSHLLVWQDLLSLATAAP
jgi:phage-related minor tail protein